MFGAKLAVAHAPLACATQAQQLAIALQLPFLGPLASPQLDTDSYDLLLWLTPAHLALCDARQPASLGPLVVTFTQGALHHRLRDGQVRNKPLARACGLKHNLRPTIFDLTAGLGTDAAVLAQLGCPVTLFERNPIIAALLADGIQRGLTADKAVAQRLCLQSGDANTLLPQHCADPNNAPQVIYCDPMFPSHTHSARSKKGMQYLQRLTTPTDEAELQRLIKLSLTYARERVVLKRPLGSPTLTGRQPDLQIISKRCRFDVFLAHPNPDSESDCGS